MTTFVFEQVYVFLSTLYGGMIIGFMYDLYRIFRRLFKPKKIATIVQDFFFWICITIVAASVLLFSNSGQLRFYTFLGFAVGTVAYNRLLSTYVIRLIIFLLQTIKKWIEVFIKVLYYPIKVVIKITRGPRMWIKKKTKPIHDKIMRLRKLPKRMARELRKSFKLIKEKK
ncbi:MAG: spore cortex biosynthesis protein YabQ [Bacillota bacterium]